ncbi:glycosyl transferase GT17 family protein [Kineothrix sedimenti]|uniref:Glycosyl transferase GT17 family protein n=1 Tax=Kineothrix sedimenti TaxID=3123317 RepID=A0ABZ3ETG0_9FIRM
MVIGMVYDSFQFFNELDILLLRMHILNDVVDKFVISESTVTFSGDEKPLFYAENKEMFKEFEHKIIHNVVDDTPMDCDAFTRDHHQKCAVARGLSGCKPEDIVIFSDVDEIPNPETLKTLIPKVEDGKIYMLAQRLFYCYLDMEEVSGRLLSVTGDFDGVEKPMWLGTKVCRYSMLEHYTTEELRNKEQKTIGVRVPDGGWHFSYMGGGKNQSVEERVKYKIKSAAHQEYNNRSTLSKVRKNIKNHEDIFGREAQMVQVKVDETFPAYLRENIDKYRYLLYKEPKWFDVVKEWFS